MSIITRGLGSNLLITRGYGRIIVAVEAVGGGISRQRAFKEDDELLELIAIFLKSKDMF